MPGSMDLMDLMGCLLLIEANCRSHGTLRAGRRHERADTSRHQGPGHDTMYFFFWVVCLICIGGDASFICLMEQCLGSESIDHRD